MTNSETILMREYERLVQERGNGGQDSLMPADHVVNWEDQPSKFKIYSNVPRFSLPPVPQSELCSLQNAATAPSIALRMLTLERLALLLAYTNGLLRRKLDITWNADHRQLAAHRSARYSRPAASGGGLYPVEFYVVAGSGSFLLPGVYHYDNAHHALERLYTGDVTSGVREAALHHPAVERAQIYLLLSVNFWKNCFKYYDFSYHVVTQDLGAALGTLNLVARGAGILQSQILWFRDEQLNRLAGFEGTEESVMALVPFDGPPAGEHNVAAASERIFQCKSHQASRKVFEPPLLGPLHRSAFVEDEPRPDPGAIAAATIEGPFRAGLKKLALPAAPEIATDVLSALRSRSSSWGKMRSWPALSATELSALLRFADRSIEQQSDVKNSPRARFTRLMVLVNHVEGLRRGVYAYDPEEHALGCVTDADLTDDIQGLYFLQNYNLEQVSCLIAITGRMESMLDVFGSRGVRVLHVEVGMRAQAIYVASAGLKIGCGAVLGFNNIGMNRMLRIDGKAETSLLLMMIGNQMAESNAFEFPLV